MCNYYVTESNALSVFKNKALKVMCVACFCQRDSTDSYRNARNCGRYALATHPFV